MRGLLFMEPVSKGAIQGGIRLKDVFGYDTPSSRTDECRAISAYKNGDRRIVGGIWKGQSLSSLWENHPGWFGAVAGCHKESSLLVKIIDTRNDLNIQVHPDNAYAGEHENGSLGKTEYWYTPDCDPDAIIVIGHYVDNKDEAERMIEEKRWKDFIWEIPVGKGGFFQISPGCVHVIKGGTLVLRTRRSSDIIYRIYDCDRLFGGKPRQLHIKESIDVIEAPFKEDQNAVPAVAKETDSGRKERLVTRACYTVDKIDATGCRAENYGDSFANVGILGGEGSTNGTPVSRGQHFIVPAGFRGVIFEGSLPMTCFQAV